MIRAGMAVGSIVFCLLGIGCSTNQSQNIVKDSTLSISEVWVSDLGDGTYKNPIIYADYSDPDVIRVGDDFYMTASSFNCVPGLPILHSRDMVNWQLIGHALKRLEPEAHYSKPQHGNGVYAPSIRFHNGKYYIFWGDPDFGIFMIKSEDPAGDWSSPILVKEGKGMIDPCPLWDNDGRVYMVHAYAASRSGINSVLVVNEINADATAIIGDDVLVFDGMAGHPIIEGPKFYKREGYYYIFAPAGSVTYGWQTILRSKNIFGPYEEKVVLHQGNTEINGPHQGGWVELASGESWFIHFQDQYVYGRVVHLQPVTWIDDWPMMGTFESINKPGEPVTRHKKPTVNTSAYQGQIATPPTTDEFNSNTIGLQWQWHANPRHTWAFPSQALGVLRLNCVAVPSDHRNMWDVPNLLLQKFPAPEFTVTTKLNFTHLPRGGKSGKAGLMLMGVDYAYISIEKHEKGYLLSQVACINAPSGKPEIINDSVIISQNELFFRVSAGHGGLSHFSYSLDGESFKPLGNQFIAKAGRWIGAKVGLFAIRPDHSTANGYVDFDWFRVH